MEGIKDRRQPASDRRLTDGQVHETTLRVLSQELTVPADAVANRALLVIDIREGLPIP